MGGFAIPSLATRPPAQVMVEGDGIEPPTRRFSASRSTPELPFRAHRGAPCQFRQVLKRLRLSVRYMRGLVELSAGRYKAAMSLARIISRWPHARMRRRIRRA